MAESSDPFAQNILGVSDLVSNPINKVPTATGENREGLQGEKYDSLSFSMPDEELLDLKDAWEAKYAPYETKHKEIVKQNLQSYLGKKPNGEWLAGEMPLAANLQFEAEETFLAATLAKNPEPVVFADNTELGNAIATSVKTMLAFHSKELALRRKLGIMVRQWSMNHLGVLKVGWKKEINDVTVENRKIQNFIFDPEGYVDAYGDFIGYLGERVEVSAEDLIDLFPSEKEYVHEQTESKLGSKVVYTEWWSPDNSFSFITFKDKVLDKYKNPYWRYEETKTDLMGNDMTDEMGDPITFKPRNHFAVPKKPYIFLSVFSLQERPHDITGLLEQNISNQNLIQKRTDQIDYNASSANNSYAFSEDNFNQETAKQAANARRLGHPILIPSGGPIDRAILPLDAQPLPAFIAEELETSKNDLRSSWGVQGIVSQQPREDVTARGMILNQAHDTSRISGGIGEAIESVAEGVFNWLTQLYYKFYDEKHFAAIMGNAKAVEFVTLSNADLDRQLIVSVAPDSMRPKDDITTMNLAQQLFEVGAIGPKTLLKMLDFPDPDKSAADGLLYKLNPQLYMQINFPQEAQQAQGAMAQAQPNPGNGVIQPEPTAPPTNLGTEPASAALSNVQLPQ